MTASPSSPANRYSVERAQFPRDKERAISLWRGNLGDATRTESKFEWFYEQSPTGEPFALLLNFASEAEALQPVGIAAAGLRTFLLGDRPVEAGVLVDLAVSPQHRTLFPALMLQKAMRQAGLEARQWLYGFPNYKAAPVFQRAGYAKLGTMTRFVRVLRATEYLAARAPRPVAAALGPLVDAATTARFAALRRGGVRLHWTEAVESVDIADVAETATGPLLRGARTPEFLRWRFANVRGRVFSGVNVEALDGTPTGYWIVRAAEGMLEVSDCAPALLASPGARNAWNALFAEARKRGFRSVSFECLAPASFIDVLRSVGMLPRADRPVFMALREGAPFAVSADNLYLTAADEDE